MDRAIFLRTAQVANILSVDGLGGSHIRLHHTGTELLELIMGIHSMTRLGLHVLCDNRFLLGFLIRCNVRFQGWHDGQVKFRSGTMQAVSLRTYDSRSSIDGSVVISLRQLAVAVEPDQGTRSRGDGGWLDVKRGEILRKCYWDWDLETWISFSPSIVKCVVQPIFHGSFSSKVQATAADVFDQMQTSARGGVRIKLHRILIEHEARNQIQRWKTNIPDGDITPDQATLAANILYFNRMTMKHYYNLCMLVIS